MSGTKISNSSVQEAMQMSLLKKRIEQAPDNLTVLFSSLEKTKMTQGSSNTGLSLSDSHVNMVV